MAYAATCHTDRYVQQKKNRVTAERNRTNRKKISIGISPFLAQFKNEN
jgi:hypothetical protein